MADTPTFVSKLDNEGYMPLSYLVSLPSLECFGVSIPELVDVISKMEALSLSSDNKGVRISLPVARKTLIIRDTPEGTTEDTIRSLLPEFTIESIKEEIGRSWFVTLLSEEEASRAIALLQTMTIGEQPIKARIKSEFYMKVFMRRLQTVMATTKPISTPTKLSSNARPFEMAPERLKELNLKMKMTDELQEIKDKYGDERKTDIVYASEELNPEDFYADDEMIITISHMGYIKRTPLSEFRAQGRGGVGAKGSETRDEDFVEYIYPASMHATLLIFTAKGKCYWLKVFEIPEGAKNSKGRAIQNLLNIEPDDKVNAFIRVKKLTTDTEFINSHYLLFCTKKGVIKKTLLEAYSRPRQNGVNAITLREDDGLIEVCMTNGNNEVLIANRNGRAIRFHENAVRVMGRTASGVRGMTLDDDSNDEVVGMVCIKDKEKETVLVVSEQGYGKRSNIEDYRITNRGGKGVKTINITEKTGKLVAIKNVTDENDIMIINKSGIAIRMKVSDLNVIGRATQGVRLINLGKRNDEIASVCKVLSQTEEEIAEEKAQREALEDAAIHEHPIENTDFEDVSDDVESNENADDTEGTTEE